MASSPRDVKTLFVGSTARDLYDYRAQVQDVLLKMAEITVFLSEDWSGELADTLTRCRDRVRNVHGYFGIFAFWYGSIPPGRQRSVTHMEFDWAVEHWAGTKPFPVAVFMPQGDAETELRRRADQLFEQDHGDLAEAERLALRARLDTQLDTFHSHVQNHDGRWGTVNLFKDTGDLRERALVVSLRWKGGPFEAPNGRDPQDEELGSIGRDEQSSAAAGVFGRLSVRADIPAVAFLVTGGEDAGQGELCGHLLTLQQFKRGRRPARGRPSAESYSVPTFVAWCASVLGLRAESEVDTIAELARLIHAALQPQQLTLMVDQVERFPGGLAGFHEEFWKPLYAALAAFGTTRWRLVVVVAEYTGQPELWRGRSCPHDGELDCALLVELPRLEELKPLDVAAWLERMEVVNHPPGRLRDLADLVTRTSAGVPDGNPRRVFARLRKETLWPNEDSLP